MPIFSKLFFFSYFVFFICLPAFFYSNSFPAQRVISLRGTYLRRWRRRIIIYWEILKEPKKEKVCQNRLVMNVRSMEPSRLCHICILYFCQNALPVLLNLLKDVWGRNEKVIDRTQTSNRMKLFEST